MYSGRSEAYLEPITAAWAAVLIGLDLGHGFPSASSWGGPSFGDP